MMVYIMSLMLGAAQAWGLLALAGAGPALGARGRVLGVRLALAFGSIGFIMHAGRLGTGLVDDMNGLSMIEALPVLLLLLWLVGIARMLAGK